MSNREIIEWLKKKAEAVPMPGARKMYEAAAKALEAAQPELGTNLAEVGTDCISRQDALEAFGLSEKTRKYGGDHSGYDTMMMYEIQDTIEDLPPIQPKLLQPWEVLVAQAVLPQPKRGKWIKTARWGRVYYCDQCRNYLDFDGVNAGRGSANFCPNCGAKMEVTE